MDIRTPEGKQELGRRIQSAIAEAGYDSLPVFAETLGCSRALIYQYAKGEVLVQIDRLQGIAELTGKPLEWFFTSRVNGVSAEVERLSQELSVVRSRAQELEASLSASREALAGEQSRGRESLAEALRLLCLCSRRAGDHASVLEHAPRWRELARTMGDTAGRLDAELQLAHAWIEAGEFRRAQAAAERVLEAADEAGAERMAQSARQELIRALETAGDVESARGHAEQLASSDRWWPRWSGRLSLAALDERTGALDSAEAHLRRAAIVIDDAAPSVEYQTIARTYLASNRINILLARGLYRQALDESDALRSLAAQASLPDQLREAALDACIAQLRVGQLEAATAGLSQLGEWAGLSEDRRMAALVMAFESEALRHFGDVDAARLRALQAVDAATEAGRGHLLAEAELALGHVHILDGRLQEAAYHLERCAGRCRKLGLHKPMLAALLGLAECQAVQDKGEDALTQVQAEAASAGYRDLEAAAAAVRARYAPPRKTAELCRHAVELCRESGYYWPAASALLLLARADLAGGRPRDAAQALRELEEWRAGAATTQLPASSRQEVEALKAEVGAALPGDGAAPEERSAP